MPVAGGAAAYTVFGNLLPELVAVFLVGRYLMELMIIPINEINYRIAMIEYLYLARNIKSRDGIGAMPNKKCCACKCFECFKCFKCPKFLCSCFKCPQCNCFDGCLKCVSCEICKNCCNCNIRLDKCIKCVCFPCVCVIGCFKFCKCPDFKCVDCLKCKLKCPKDPCKPCIQCAKSTGSAIKACLCCCCYGCESSDCSDVSDAHGHRHDDHTHNIEEETPKLEGNVGGPGRKKTDKKETKEKTDPIHIDVALNFTASVDHIDRSGSMGNIDHANQRNLKHAETNPFGNNDKTPRQKALTFDENMHNRKMSH